MKLHIEIEQMDLRCPCCGQTEHFTLAFKHTTDWRAGQTTIQHEASYKEFARHCICAKCGEFGPGYDFDWAPSPLERLAEAAK